MNSSTRQTHVIPTDTSSRSTNIDRGASVSHPGGARPKEGRHTWRRGENLKSGFKSHERSSNPTGCTADSAWPESEKSQQGRSKGSRDGGFRRTDRASYQGIMEVDADDRSGHEKQAGSNNLHRASQSHEVRQTSSRGRGAARTSASGRGTARTSSRGEGLHEEQNGRSHGAFGGRSQMNSSTRQTHVTPTDTSSRSTNIDRGASVSHPGGARPKEGRHSWRRGENLKSGFKSHERSSNPTGCTADSAGPESEKSQRGRSKGSRDGGFRRTDRASYQGDPSGGYQRWRRNQSDAPQTSGRYQGQVQVQRRSTVRPIPEAELQKLLREQPINILSCLVSKKGEWSSLLNQNIFSDDLVILTLRVLYCICDIDSVQDARLNLNIIFDLLASSCFLSKHLSRYLVSVTEKMQLGEDGNESIGLNVNMMLKVLSVYLQHKPNGYGEMAVVLILLDKLTSSPAFVSQAYLMIEVQKLKESFHILEESQQTKQTVKVKPPPNNFRDIPIFPDSSEIRTPTQPFLRKNIIHGRYQDVEHYLDVQFRLLREDFVAPLREGIIEFLSVTNSRHQDIRVYRNVTIQSKKMGRRSLQYTVKLDVNGLKQINWGKRFLYGSFVCLTQDKFQHIICASVADRNEKDLKKGLVDVCFLTECSSTPTGTFVMVESVAFFEPYRHVLLGLQRMISDDFPFERYIVNVFSFVRTPKYLSGECSDVYDLRSLVVETDQVFEDEGLTETFVNATCVSILDPQSWPTAEALHLDESQKAAVQAALTKEFAIIQGPPGTGKTYIGLKIIELLLYNLLTTTDASPILVVCYTNHALDQFLEGVLRFGERNLVRVGRQSKSEVLKSFKFSSLKKQLGRHHPMKDIQKEKELRAITSRLQYTLLSVAFAKTVVYKAETLQPFMTDDTQRTLFEKFKTEKDPTANLLNWLFVVDIEGETDRPDCLDSNQDQDKFIDVEDESNRIQQERQAEDEAGFSFFDAQRKQQEHSVLRRNAAYSSECEKRCGNSGYNLQEELQKDDMMSETEVSRVTNVWSLTLSDRWRLYRLWVNRYIEEQEELLSKYRRSYDSLSKEVETINASVDLEVLSKARVIGMTTTGAARCQSMLQLLGPRIVIVEEAAEVLEAHIITTLTAKCQHLIMIGDHQQLKPNPTVYRLAKVFKMDTSLFERMINNGVPCQTLTHQHRMRPEISKLMKKHFYKNLHDDESVKGFDDIKGVAHNMFFIDHTKLEDGSGDDNKTKSNHHEAEVLVELCRYLLHQGYRPKQITILTTYLGQLSTFKKLMDKETFEGVRVSVVDNFQGEENDIILLSLVRSNKEGSIGFLKTSNRVCVALSRARMGFYCIGNGTILKKTQIWQDIIGTLEAENQVGSTLQLVCQNHPGTVAEVASAEDFRFKVPLGGCGRPCEFTLACGHRCESSCHPYDCDHTTYKCRVRCTQLCKRGEHSRNIECFESDNPCKEMVLKLTPKCGHESQVMCDDFESADCTVPCTKKITCGHSCTNLCWQECTLASSCTVKVTRTLRQCRHKFVTECSGKKYLAECPHECDKILSCGHKCPNKCGKSCPKTKRDIVGWRVSEYKNCNDFCTERCGDQLSCGHTCPNKCGEPCPKAEVDPNFGEYLELEDYQIPLICTVMVSKRLPRCGHTVIEECYRDVNLRSCTVICNKELPCGHRCSLTCSEPCTCLLSVKKTLQPCGHSFQIPCNKTDDLNKCTKKCPKLLTCGHRCPNNCGDPCPGGADHNPSSAQINNVVAIVCQRSVMKKLPGCGHSLALPCFKDVESVACLEKCTEILPCKHNCPNRCGEPCPTTTDEGDDYSLSDNRQPFAMKCQEGVTKKLVCGHIVRMPCFQNNKLLLCPKPCENILSCGHRCSRKCGEACLSGGHHAESESENEGETLCSGADAEVELPSWKCQESVYKMLPKCGHFVKLPCCKKATTAICPESCQRVFPCGHKCPK
ncbi:NFX1-type zinc finger-containing protein 1-like [Asterias rubens]|uniref:NFX1-type zinc finger-containing protein 1-like n=1 Tax=Asterias rubens TaxID=7604 RepID=UPI001455D9A3|nr:NFX1-type zinc finger-containing protein 1-like [Asterias rubens]